METTPCKNCKDRHQNCHAECDRYIDWKKKLAELKTTISHAKYEELLYTRRPKTNKKNNR